MKKYRGPLKEEVLKAVGCTTSVYDEIKGDQPFPDSVDRIIISASLRLKRKYLPVFGLLYHCHSVKKTKESIALTHDKELKEETIRDYMRRSKSDFIKLMKDDPDILNDVKEAIEHDRQKSKENRSE